MLIYISVAVILIYLLYRYLKKITRYRVVEIDDVAFSEIERFLPEWFEKIEIGQALGIAEQKEYNSVLWFLKESFQKSHGIQIFMYANSSLEKINTASIKIYEQYGIKYWRMREKSITASLPVEMLVAEIGRDCNLASTIAREILQQVYGYNNSEKYQVIVSRLFMDYYWVYDAFNRERKELDFTN